MISTAKKGIMKLFMEEIILGVVVIVTPTIAQG